MTSGNPQSQTPDELTNRDTVIYRPSPQLSRTYLREKYGLVPLEETRQSFLETRMDKGPSVSHGAGSRKSWPCDEPAISFLEEKHDDNDSALGQRQVMSVRYTVHDASVND